MPLRTVLPLVPCVVPLAPCVLPLVPCVLPLVPCVAPLAPCVLPPVPCDKPLVRCVSTPDTLCSTLAPPQGLAIPPPPSIGTLGDTCDVFNCPDGFFGQNCAGECPGGAANVCSGRGACVSKVYGTGRCACDAGYALADCSAECPGGASGPCTGHGVCVEETAECACNEAWATRNCSVPCPVVGGAACAGHGRCADGADGDGRCACADGYARADCSARCPGYGPGRPSCAGHGACDPLDAVCACVQDDGHWGGADCAACAAGWYGDRCGGVCVNGRTEGRTCACDAGWAAANCTLACPGPGRACSGHGRCWDGPTGNGTCDCDPDYYTADCGVFCAPTLCVNATAYPAPHPMCHPESGACGCQRNASGHWGGPECNRCAEGYWDPTLSGLCDTACACNGRGNCNQLDGTCACYDDAVLGHWAGPTCDVCADGWALPLCLTWNVGNSRSGEFAALSSNPDADADTVVVTDEEHSLVYTGGLPLQVITSDDRQALIWTLDLGGMVRSGYVATGGDAVVLMVEKTAGEGAQQVPPPPPLSIPRPYPTPLYP